jgi:beta-galactosidase
MFEDVYTFNDFFHDGTKNILRSPDTVKKGVPYLVTEYNGHMFPTKKSDSETHLVEHALRHYRVINESSNMDGLSGTIGWCMADYNTHDYFGSGDNVCYHGVLDMFRLMKPAAYVYASQKENEAVLEVLSTMSNGDYAMGVLEKVYVATNLDYVKLYKDDIFIADFYPENDSNLAHPIVIVDDFIGNQLIDNEKFSIKDSDKTKKLFSAVTKYATNLPVTHKLTFLKLMKKYNLSLDDAMQLYFKYNNQPDKYRFVGIKAGVIVKEVVKDIVRETSFILKVDSQELVIAETYDVTRVVVSKVDQNNNVIKYTNEGVVVKVSGGIDLIGPKYLSLVGGEVSFWVKTNLLKSNGFIEVQTERDVLKTEIKVKVTNHDRKKDRTLKW